jgi:metal-sulfur cluster biosynthetic enzyme
MTEAQTERGVESLPEPPAPRADEPSFEELEEAMRDVVDPELGINVVDLGLVYDIRLDDGVAVLDMTLTSAACPLTDVIEEQTRSALCAGPDGGLAKDIKINWVWLPPWGPELITDDGREQLQALGFQM